MKTDRELKLEKEYQDKSIEWLETRKLELSDARDEYYLITFILDRKNKEKYEQDIRKLRNRLIRQTDFTECEYPSIGYPASNGSAYFKDKDIADELIGVLVSSGHYTYGYILEWSGPGQYIVEPSYRYDHDNQIIYTATFRKDDL